MEKKMLKYETRIESFETKADTDVLSIKFYGCAFGNVDRVDDIIKDTACDAWLQNGGDKDLKMCWMHDTREVIGVITSVTKDEHGLLCEADILPTSRGNDASVLIKAGALDKFSIGYYADEYHYEGKDGRDIRVLDAITIHEVSVVTFPANPEARLVSAKDEDFKEIVKAASDDELDAMKESIETERLARLVSGL